MDILTEKERAFLEKIERNKIKHNNAQQKYKNKNKEKIKEYNKKYQENIKEQKAEIRNKIKDERDENIKIEIEKIPKISKKPKPNNDNIGKTTIDDYIRKSNILNKLIKGQDIPNAVKNELNELLTMKNDDKTYSKILNEMDYIKDIEETISKIRTKYKNDNTYKSYINVLCVISSHFQDLKDVYKVYSSIIKETNIKVQEKREENDLEDYEKEKIISVGDNEFYKNIEKLDKIEDILIYALYVMFPSRRLEYRNMRITDEEDEEKLNEINYLIIPSGKFIFNDYKTSKTYNKQIFDIPINLKNIINKYINEKDLKNGDLLFKTDKDKIITEGNFSSKISNIFKKVYNIPICIRYLRMSWASSIYLNNPSIKEIKELSYKMAHSTIENRLYNKIFDKK